MKEDLSNIIEHYGPTHQLKKLSEEVFELQEAIITHELKKSVEYEIPLTEIIGTKEHIIEEVADVMVLLNQFIHHYEIEEIDILKVMKYKIDRQIERMSKEDQ